MKPKATLIVGCPGSGKSWVAKQLADKFHHVPHDDSGNPQTYVNEIARQAKTATKPLLLETPFSVSNIAEPLARQGIELQAVYIQEKPTTIASRYWQRTGQLIPKGHLTRQETYRQKAAQTGAFTGTSQQVLDHLKAK